MVHGDKAEPGRHSEDSSRAEHPTGSILISTSLIRDVQSSKVPECEASRTLAPGVRRPTFHVTPPWNRGLKEHVPTTGSRPDRKRRCPGMVSATRPRPWSPTLRAVEMDGELLTRVRTGDERAFVTLVARYQQPMFRLARSMVSSEQVAEEAVQDTWMGVVRGIDRFEGRSSFKTWLFRILVNRVRAAGSREPTDPSIETIQAVDPNRFDADGQWADPVDHWTEASEDRLDAATWIPILKSALDRLPARQRQVVVLRDVEGLSNDETCAVLGISVGNQRILLHRGRARLREILDTQIEKRRPC
jgi:RNA polymerase sigma-70 factor, ECF subfamily